MYADVRQDFGTLVIAIVGDSGKIRVSRSVARKGEIVINHDLIAVVGRAEVSA